MAESVIRVEGLRSLERAFRAADKELAGDLRDALQEAAAPVRRDAQALAASEIENINDGDPWASMRTGVGRSIVYVAPVERGVKTRGRESRHRPNLGNLLMDRALEPALEENRGEVEHRLGQMLDEVCDVWERTR